jgi:hypothetical protein
MFLTDPDTMLAIARQHQDELRKDASERRRARKGRHRRHD